MKQAGCKVAKMPVRYACNACRKPAATKRGSYDCGDLGLPGVTLEGIKIVVCDDPACGNRDPVIPYLHRLISKLERNPQRPVTMEWYQAINAWDVQTKGDSDGSQ